MNFANNIDISEDGNLLCLTNENGIKIYDTKRFILLKKIKDFVGNLSGEILKCKLFPNSKKIGFILLQNKRDRGSVDLTNCNEYIDLNFLVNTLVIFDINNNEIIGKIGMKNGLEIDDYLLTKYFIIIMVKDENIVLLFKTKTLEYFFSIGNVKNGNVIYSDNYFYKKKDINDSVDSDRINKEEDILNKAKSFDVFNNKEDNYDILSYNKKYTFAIDENDYNKINIEDNEKNESKEDMNKRENNIKEEKESGISLINDFSSTSDISNISNINNISKIVIENSETTNFNITSNKCILAYLDTFNSKKICFIEYYFDKSNDNVINKKETSIEFELKNSEGIKNIFFLSSLLIVTSFLGNKIHIYNISPLEFKYCLILGNFPYDISSLRLDNKEKILAIITNNKYIKLFKLKKLSNQCQCEYYKDENTSINENRGLFDKIKHKLGTDRNEYLCRFKINFDEETIKNNKSIIFFDKNKNDIVYVAQNNGCIIKLKFDRKKPKEMILIRSKDSSENEGKKIANNTVSNDVNTSY